MTVIHKVVDYENPSDVKRYLDRYSTQLWEDLPDHVLMTFVGVLYEAKGRENLNNRRIAIDYLGFTGFGAEELERIAKNTEEDKGLRRLANDWLRNCEVKMTGYLCVNEEKNEFGRKNDVIKDFSVEGVIVSFVGKGYLNEIRTIYLTKVQRMNLGYNADEFRPKVFDERWDSLGDIYLTSRGREIKAVCSKTDSRVDSFCGCGIRVSTSVAQELSLKIGNKVELSTRSRDKWFGV